MIDENQFFRQATLKICGNLALEKALHDALLYIRDYIPVDAFFMEYFDPESSAARTIARADRKGGVPLDLLTPIPIDAHLDESMKSKTLLGKALVLNHPEEIPMARTMLYFHQYDEYQTSLLTMRLIGEGEVFGGLVALAEQRDAFTTEHAHLLSLLAQPFTIALANALQHRDVLLTKKRLVDENEFFRNITMRICGNLVLEEGLHACMEYLNRRHPRPCAPFHRNKVETTPPPPRSPMCAGRDESPEGLPLARQCAGTGERSRTRPDSESARSAGFQSESGAWQGTQRTSRPAASNAFIQRNDKIERRRCFSHTAYPGNNKRKSPGKRRGRRHARRQSQHLAQQNEKAWDTVRKKQLMAGLPRLHITNRLAAI